MPNVNEKDALLEIGVEELPVRLIAPALQQMEQNAARLLADKNLPFKSLRTFGTPRRLALLIQGLSERSNDTQTKVIGPPERIAKDAEGWTQVAHGFARKQGVPVSALTLEEGKVCALIELHGAPTKTILASLFPALVTAIQFPKTMRWESSGMTFARPIKSLIALYGAEQVRFALAGVKAGRVTRGLHTLTAKKIAIASADRYQMVLKNNCVIVDSEERGQKIVKQCENAVQKVDGTAVLSPRLVAEVANLVEHPVAIMGSFSEDYLELPEEVLVTCMEHHQRYFSVRDSKGKLMAHFLGIRNGMSLHQEIVREGYERVLAARLSDARFFYEQDLKRTLASRLPDLDKVVFHKRLGSMGEKVRRVENLTRSLTEQLGFSAEDRDAALEAARLFKSDLTTQMVFEFPELQGIVGRLYAEREKLSSKVARAIEQSYWPLSAESKLPVDAVSAVVAVADKIDTLAGDFAVGLIPSGSADPYGLRRTAVGVLRILEQTQWAVDLPGLISGAISLYGEKVSAEEGKAAQTALNEFFLQRLSGLWQDQGTRADEARCILGASFRDVPDAGRRLKALQTARGDARFAQLATVLKRATNIFRHAAKEGNTPWKSLVQANPYASVQVELLQQDAERNLKAALDPIILNGVQDGRYDERLSVVAGLSQPLQSFFEGVMVMDPDPTIRRNRLSLLSGIVQLVQDDFDFTALQES